MSLPVVFRHHPSSGPPAVFLHANGFPPACYDPLLNALSGALDVYAMPLRPLWDRSPPPRSMVWRDLAQDLVTVLRERDMGPVIAIGHSMGATASIPLVAAHPELFSALVMVEPAMVKRWQAVAFRTLPYRVCRRMGPAKSTSTKRDRWPDRAAFRASCARSGLYSNFDDRGMKALVDGAVVDDAGSVKLAFPKAWEAHFYTNPPWPIPDLRTVRVPVVGVRGESSFFLDDEDWAGCTKARPNGWFSQVRGAGHLLPMERPAQTCEAVVQGLRAQGVLG